MVMAPTIASVNDNEEANGISAASKAADVDDSEGDDTIIGRDRRGVNLQDYVEYFRNNEHIIPTDKIDHRAIMTLWNIPANADLLTVGSPLQLSGECHHYKAISELYLSAKRCLFEDNDVREARVLILTASLIEQCRVTGVRTVRAFFTDSSTSLYAPSASALAMSEEALKQAGIGMQQVLPFCYRGKMNSESEDAMRSYLQNNLDLEKQKEDLLREEPMVQVRCQGGKITLNSLTSFKYLVRSHEYDDCFGEAIRDLPDESLRIVIRGRNHNNNNNKSVGNKVNTEGSYFPYAKHQTLAILGLKNGDVIEVEEIEKCDSNGIDPSLIRTVNACFDPSVPHWFIDTNISLYKVIGEIFPKDDDGVDDFSQHHPLLFREVMKFWSEPGTGRINFLAADAQMVSTYSNDRNSVPYVGTCYATAKNHFDEGRIYSGADSEAAGYVSAVGAVLTAGLMEQGQFTDMFKLLELYSTLEVIDEDLMRKNDPYLYQAYAATKSQKSLREHVCKLDVEAQKAEVKAKSLCVNVTFFRVDKRDVHSIEVNPLITLETLLGIHTDVSKYSYQFVQIIVDEGSPILFSDSRRQTLTELGIKNHSVLNMEDVKRQPDTLSVLPGVVTEERLLKELLHRVTNIAKHFIPKQMKRFMPEFSLNLGESGSILNAIAMYFATAENMKMICSDRMDKFEGISPYDALYQLALEYLEGGDYFEAKSIVLMAGFIEQCQISGVVDLVVHFTTQKFLSLTTPFPEKMIKYKHLGRQCDIVNDLDNLARHLKEFDISKHINELRGSEPRINVVFSNRSNGKDEAYMSNVNAHMTFTHFVKKHAVENHGKSLQSLRIVCNSRRMFLSTCGKNSLKQLGIKDNDAVIVEDVSKNGSETKKQLKSQTKGKTNSKKKKLGRIKQKKKPHQQIIIPEAEEDLRKDHSKMLSPVLDQLERERLRFIRLKLNNLLIKKTSAKERKHSRREKKVEVIQVFNPPTDALEGKAGKVVFPVVVGHSEYLYKSSKKSAKVQRNQIVREIDLHGCTAAEATSKLNNEMPILTDAAMKEETCTMPVDIICGGGHQILSEVVEQWIRKNGQVANRPKGFV